MKKLFTLFTVLLLCTASSWADELPIDRSGWTIRAYSEPSWAIENAADGRISAAIDGKTSTWYHSDWQTAGKKENAQQPIQGFMIELASEEYITKIEYLGRTDRLATHATSYRVYALTETEYQSFGVNMNTITDIADRNTALSTETLGTATASGTWSPSTSTPLSVPINKENVKYILFLADALYNDGNYFTCSEFNAYHETTARTVTYNYKIDGKTVATKQFVVGDGDAYPTPSVPTEFNGISTDFYSIGAKPEGAVTADVEKDITVTQSLPFPASSSFENANWYLLKFDLNTGGNCFLYYKAGDTYITKNRVSTDLSDRDLFCAVGNVVDGFRIYNKAAGQNYILSSSTTMSGETGANTYPIMTDISGGVPSGNNEFWDITKSSHGTNGFFLGQHGYPSNRINNRSGKIAYWTGGADKGSTFVAVSPADITLPSTEKLYTLQNANYPTQYVANTGNTCTDAEGSRGIVMIEPAATDRQYYISVNGNYLKQTTPSDQISTTTNKSEAVPYTIEMHCDMYHIVFMDATKTWADPYQNFIYCAASKNLVGRDAGDPASQWMCHEVEGSYVVYGTKVLSKISGYESLTSIVVTEGSTLYVDVEFDHDNISGPGTIIYTDERQTSIATNSLDITYTGGAGMSDSRVQIAHNGGSVTLSGATYYLNESNNATQTTVNFEGATVDYGGGVMGIGTAIYNINNTTITTSGFITSQGDAGRSAVVNLTGNSVINVTGSTNEDRNTSSIMIGHWNGSSSVTLSDNAQISAPNAQLLVGKTGNNQTITLNDRSNITAKGIKASANAWSTNTLNLNGGSLTLGEVGITTYGQHRINVNVTENAIITATAATLPITQPVTIAAGKTLTINGGDSRATVTFAQAPTLGEGSSIHFVNTTIDFNDVRDLSAYTFSGCTARFIETGAEYSTGNFTFTNVPDGITTILVKKYDYKSTDDTEYYTATKTGTTATLSHKVGVSGSAAWLDYTFDTETNPTGTNQYIQNYGNAGSDQNLKLDGNYNGNTSFNDNGTLKVKSTPWRDMTWPTDYTVAVSANFPDVENGCLMAFGSSTHGSNNYLALVRGASSNEIKLVKGTGSGTHYDEIATMSAENATAADHLVVFTKLGDEFKVYLDGVNITKTTYSDPLGTGFQIGSLHGGVGSTGLVRVSSMSEAIKNAVYAKAVRVYDYVISDAQMEKLKDKFPYISKGGSYSRTITTDANLSASGAWYNQGDKTNVDLPSDAVIDGVTYHPDVEITTSANATLTVNANMNARNVEFKGNSTLTIAAGDGQLKVYGSVTANSPVTVKYGAADFSTVPVSVGDNGSICFDFSAYDFSSVDEETQYVVTGNTSDYGNRITAVYPTDTYHTYELAHNAGDNNYILTVSPTVALKQQQAINAAAPYFNDDNRLVGTGVGKYTVKLGEKSYMDFAIYGADVMAWKTLSDCVEPTITINQPTSGYYMLKSKYDEATGYYLQCDNLNTDDDTNAKQTTTTDAKNIFYITVGESNSTIKSYVTGYYFGKNTRANYTADAENPVHWTFTEGNNKGTYTLTSDYSGSKILYGWSGYNNNVKADRNPNTTTDDHTDWILVPVAAEDLPVIEAPGSTDKNKKILGSIQTVEDVKGKITAATAFVDLSEATISGTNIDAIKGVVAEVNPNAIIIAPQGTVPGSATTNVLLKTDEGKYTCNNLQLTDDLIPVFEAGTEFVETNVTYNRATSANQWGTICLPYAVRADGDVAYYRLAAKVDGQTLRFEKVTDETTAYEPYLIKKAADAGLTISSASDAAEFTLGNNPEPQDPDVHDGFVLKGTMVNTSVVNGTTYTEAYTDKGYQQAVTDPNAYYFEASSKKFRALNGRFNLKAFRAYLTATGTASADDPANARSILGIDISEDGQATGISFVESEDGKTVEIVYDLNGRRLQEARKGINIINGKKVIK